MGLAMTIAVIAVVEESRYNIRFMSSEEPGYIYV